MSQGNQGNQQSRFEKGLEAVGMPLSRFKEQYDQFEGLSAEMEERFGREAAIAFQEAEPTWGEHYAEDSSNVQKLLEHLNTLCAPVTLRNLQLSYRHLLKEGQLRKVSKCEPKAPTKVQQLEKGFHVPALKTYAHNQAEAQLESEKAAKVRAKLDNSVTDFDFHSTLKDRKNAEKKLGSQIESLKEASDESRRKIAAEKGRSLQRRMGLI